MKNKKERILHASPLKKYDSAKYPTFMDTHNHPALLEKLPSRWEKNAKVMARIGLMGALALAGCGDSKKGPGDVIDPVGPHGGGGGPLGSACYVPHLSEAEMLVLLQEDKALTGIKEEAVTGKISGKDLKSKFDANIEKINTAVGEETKGMVFILFPSRSVNPRKIRFWSAEASTFDFIDLNGMENKGEASKGELANDFEDSGEYIEITSKYPDGTIESLTYVCVKGQW